MVDLEIFQQSTGVVPIKNVLRPSDILYESWKGLYDIHQPLFLFIQPVMGWPKY